MAHRPNRNHHRQPQRHQHHASGWKTLAITFLGTPLRAVTTLAVGCILFWIVYMKIAPVQAHQLITNLSVSFAHTVHTLFRPVVEILLIIAGGWIVILGIRKSLGRH